MSSEDKNTRHTARMARKK
ncbi:hypothetical protein, partial [Methylotenera sp.]